MILDPDTFSEITRELQHMEAMDDCDKQLVMILTRLLGLMADLERKVDNNYRLLRDAAKA